MSEFEQVCMRIFQRRLVAAFVVSAALSIILLECWSWKLLSPLHSVSKLMENFTVKLFFASSNGIIIFSQLNSLKSKRNILLVPLLWMVASFVAGFSLNPVDCFTRIEGVHFNPFFVRNSLFFAIFGLLSSLLDFYMLKFQSVEFVFLTSLKYHAGNVFIRAFRNSIIYSVFFSVIYWFAQSKILKVLEFFLLEVAS